MLLPFHWLQDDPIISEVMLCPSFLRGLGEGVGWGDGRQWPGGGIWLVVV